MQSRNIVGWGAVALVSLVVIFVMLVREDRSSSLELRVDFSLWTGWVLQIKNVGRDTITIVGVTANDRTDCAPHKGSIQLEQDRKRGIKDNEWSVKVGETALWYVPCEVVRTTVRTNKGAFEYTFEEDRRNR